MSRKTSCWGINQLIIEENLDGTSCFSDAKKKVVMTGARMRGGQSCWFRAKWSFADVGESKANSNVKGPARSILAVVGNKTNRIHLTFFNFLTIISFHFCLKFLWRISWINRYLQKQKVKKEGKDVQRTIRVNLHSLLVEFFQVTVQMFWGTTVKREIGRDDPTVNCKSWRIPWALGENVRSGHRALVHLLVNILIQLRWCGNMQYHERCWRLDASYLLL